MSIAERRHRERVRLDYEISIRLEKDWKRISHCRDISMGGVSLLTHYEIPLGQKLFLHIGDPHIGVGSPEIPEIPGEVVHSCKEGNTFITGIRFDRLDPDSSMFIYRLIQYHKE